ncbi:MAG: hypothetical protein L0Y76_06840 [Ignavibacteria bacterium]|nr:hypothetical protein [Ignavibacteria bacterium]
MSFSEKTIDLLLGIKEYSNGKIKNDFELSVLLEAGYFTNKKPLFEELIFKAKFLNGALKILAENPAQDGMDKLLQEFAKNLEELTELLKNILGEADEPANDIFFRKYFEVKPDVINELALLIMDLSACKDYFNDMNHKPD